MEVLADLAKGQRPYATIVGCSDSRVPPEIVFDQGLGDLFVVRTAGNIVDDVVMGVVSPIGEQGSVIAKVAALKASIANGTYQGDNDAVAARLLRTGTFE